jgi:hypothetical protein
MQEDKQTDSLGYKIDRQSQIEDKQTVSDTR